ncbi:hypothetical protein [Microvirga makkahensis]|uniref:Uncharacterized protein n=1 Tax=Microvirga makkahensis TaxID=1128670 RepID=A0A7X3MTM4_9HYPH|nr:hypothetical protein [Microvirga makkahensis]MXQ12760.1 hypothetical protein [Microvirga makkahensis]
MDDEDDDRLLEIQPRSPATDDLARAMDWIGLSAAVGMIVFAVVLAA